MLCNNVGYCTWYSGGPAACVIPSSYVLYFVGPEHGNGIIIPLMYCITYPPVSCPGLHSTLYLDVTHSCCSPVLHLVTPPLRYSGILYYLLPTALMYVVGLQYCIRGVVYTYSWDTTSGTYTCVVSILHLVMDTLTL